MNFFRFFIIAMLFAGGALASDLQAKFQDWSVFMTNRGDKILCYTMSLPIKLSSGEGRNSFLMVTNVENDADEISLSSGVIYQKDSDVEMSFGDSKFNLLPVKARAWTYNKNDDIEIIKQMQNSSDVVISAISEIHKNISETYSLIGFSQAYKKMKEICKDK